MSCTNPNCECKPGTYANLNPPKPHAWYVKDGFTLDMLDGIEWQEKRSLRTISGQYRVEITWALDHYDIYVWRRVQEPEAFVRYHWAKYPRTAVKTANKLLRHYY